MKFTGTTINWTATKWNDNEIDPAEWQTKWRLEEEMIPLEIKVLSHVRLLYHVRLALIPKLQKPSIALQEAQKLTDEAKNSHSKCQDKKLRSNLKSLENKYNDATLKAKDAEILLENERLSRA
jgi:hypothetical protein